MTRRTGWLKEIERQLAHCLSERERTAYDWGFAQGAKYGSLGMVRIDLNWPDKPAEHRAATYGVYLGDCDRQGHKTDWEFIHAEASNFAVAADGPWPAFDQLRPLRIGNAGRKLWWLEFSTGDDGSGYYGWADNCQGGNLSVCEAIEELDGDHVEDVIRYTAAAVAAVPEVKDRELALRAHDEETLLLVLDGLDRAKERLSSELLEARAAYLDTQPLGPRSRPSALAARLSLA
jgi:hypothetical protein